MYSVYVDNKCIYDDTSTDKSLRLVNPVLELSDSSAGSFKMTVPITNVGYNSITRMTSDVEVKKDGSVIWCGRVFDESIDFWKNRMFTCEGALAFFNDTVQPPAEYARKTVKEFLQGIISVHNSKVKEKNRQFKVGKVTVDDPVRVDFRYTNYETTIECINKGLLEVLGGHLFVRKEKGQLYIDYLADISKTSPQAIEFGVNLLDYAASYDMSEFATVVIPLGKNLGPGTIGSLDEYLTVAGAKNPDGSLYGKTYVKNDATVDAYGWIEQVIHFDSVEDPDELLEKAKLYLSFIQFDSLSLEVKAFDLHYLNDETEGMTIGEMVRVISIPHGLDREFPVVKLSIPLDKPENTQFTLGAKVDSTFTSANNKVKTDLLQQISSMPTKDSVAGVTQKSVADAFATVHLSSEPTDAQSSDLSWMLVPSEDIGTLYTSQNPPYLYPTDGSTACSFKKENGWYVSTNEGIAYGNGSYSYGVLSFNLAAKESIIIRCECKGRTNQTSFGNMADSFGEISTLYKGYFPDSGGFGYNVGAEGLHVKYSFYYKEPGTSVDLVYNRYNEDESGHYYITFKFNVKPDHSTGRTNTDEYLRLRAFKARWVVKEDDSDSKIVLSGSGFSATKAVVKFPGIVKNNDLLVSGNPAINGFNIQNGSIHPSKIDWYMLKEAPLSKVYLSNGVYLWYDTAASRLKLNVNGTDTVIS